MISFEIQAPYTLRVCFDDDTEQTIDFQAILEGELFGPLRDVSLFNQVRIDPEVHTLVWPNGADFDPATLHERNRGVSPKRTTISIDSGSSILGIASSPSTKMM